MSKHKKEKKKRKRRSPSTSSSSSSDPSSGGEWVEKSPPPTARTSTKEISSKKEPEPLITGPSFLDLALSSSSSREKKEKTKNTDRPEPIELPIGIYYPNKKQDNVSSTSTKVDNTGKHNYENEFNSQRKYRYDKSDRSNRRQFQKPSSDDEDDYSSRKKDKYDRSQKQSSKQFQKPCSDSDDNSSRRKDKYDRSEKQSSRQFQKPTSYDESNYNSCRKDKHGESDRKNSKQFKKPSSDSDDDYSSQRKDSYERSESSRHYQKPTHDAEDYDSRRNDKYGKSARHEEDKRNHKHESTNDNKDSGSEKPNGAPVSHDDVNKIAAKLIKAEMMGNAELVSKLKAKLEVAKQNETPIQRHGAARTVNDGVGEKDRVVVITEQSMKDRRRTELLERKKLAFLGDNKDRWVVEGKTFANIGDEYEEEPDAKKRKKPKSMSNPSNQSSSNAIQEHKKAAQILSSCPYCTGGDTKHAPLLVDHYTEDVYLALPCTEPLTEHHCLIVTTQHTPGLRQTEPNVYESVRSLAEKLVGLFSRQGKTCVFFETVSSLKRNHCHLHCVPLDREIGDDAPLYFHKSITDLESDTRQNRTLVKIARNALCRSIPAEMEYFYVNFDWREGFVHLIENKMSLTFGEEIIGGMLDLSASRWRNPSRLSYEAQMKLKLDFLRLYNS